MVSTQTQIIFDQGYHSVEIEAVGQNWSGRKATLTHGAIKF